VAAVAVNVADVRLAGTVTDAGTGSAALFEASATTLPPVGAAWLKVTVHVAEAPDVMLAGAQASDDTRGLGVTVTVAVALPASVAVTVTACAAVTEPAVAVKPAEVAPVATASDAGTGSADVLLDASATTLTPAGAV